MTSEFNKRSYFHIKRALIIGKWCIQIHMRPRHLWGPSCVCLRFCTHASRVFQDSSCCNQSLQLIEVLLKKSQSGKLTAFSTVAGPLERNRRVSLPDPMDPLFFAWPAIAPLRGPMCAAHITSRPRLLILAPVRCIGMHTNKWLQCYEHKCKTYITCETCGPSILYTSDNFENASHLV